MQKRNWAIAAMAVLAATGTGIAGVANAGGARAIVGEPAGERGESGERGEADERGEDARELATLRNARISLAQAVTAAEAQTGLKAMEAGIDDEGRGALYEVSVVDGSAEKTVLVDTQSGKVTSVVADAEEAEDKDSD